MIYMGNYGDVNPFEYGGAFVFKDEEDLFHIVLVDNKEDKVNPYATWVRFFSLYESELKGKVEEVKKMCGWDACGDLGHVAADDLGLVAAQAAQLGILSPDVSVDFVRFTDLAQDLYYDNFCIPEFYSDISSYLKMMREEDDIVQTYNPDFIDGCVEEVVRRLSDYEEWEVFEILQKKGVTPHVLFKFELEELLYFREVFLGGFRRLGKDFCSYVFFGEPLNERAYPEKVRENIESIFRESKPHKHLFSNEV
jgi:hypothetical protein